MSNNEKEHRLGKLCSDCFQEPTHWNDFVQGKDSDMLRMRNTYIERLWECHRETLRRHTDMATSEAEEAAHDEWVQAKATDTSTMLEEPPRLPCPECEKLHALMTA